MSFKYVVDSNVNQEWKMKKKKIATFLLFSILIIPLSIIYGLTIEIVPQNTLALDFVFTFDLEDLTINSND